MPVDELQRLTYDMVLELHREWPEFKGAFLRLERRVSVLEDSRIAKSSGPPPSLAQLHRYRSEASGNYHIPPGELTEALAQRDRAEKAERWDAAIRFLGKWVLAVASAIGGAYVIHQLWK